MKKSTYTKFWIINLLALVILFTSVSLVAYWPIAVKSPEGGSKGTTINLGSGGEVSTYINFLGASEQGNLVLVPEGRVNAPNKTDSIGRSLTVVWNEDTAKSTGSAEGAFYEGDLLVTGEVALSPGEEQYKEILDRLIVIEFDNPETITFEEETTFNVTIKLNMPKNEDEYYIVRGREIRIKVTFNIKNPKETH